MEEKAQLKITALLERVSELAAAYENKIADLRVEVTLASNRIQELTNIVQQAEAEKQERELAADTDTE